jgi:flagellar motor protein MotB
MRVFVSVFILFFSFSLFSQTTCNSAQFIREISVSESNSSNVNWYKFRAKGNILDFTGNLKSDSLFEYEIFPFTSCNQIINGHTIPIRSVKKGVALLTEELWERVVEEGICVCGTCLSKIKRNNKKALKVKQGEFYLLKVFGGTTAFGFNLAYSDIDTLNPIQFSLDSLSINEVEIGMVYQLKEIFFIPGTAQYLPKSINELERLKQFLLKHKVLKVQVRGHVNGPAQTKPEFYQELSDARANAIKQFLVGNEVEEERVDEKGMSNFQMRYSSPKTAFEAGENRRVEIIITAI